MNEKKIINYAEHVNLIRKQKIIYVRVFVP